MGRREPSKLRVPVPRRQCDCTLALVGRATMGARGRCGGVSTEIMQSAHRLRPVVVVVVRGRGSGPRDRFLSGCLRRSAFLPGCRARYAAQSMPAYAKTNECRPQCLLAHCTTPSLRRAHAFVVLIRIQFGPSRGRRRSVCEVHILVSLARYCWRVLFTSLLYRQR